ncbi:hypothetical protein GCM10029992_29670 [Glycomyces albus]
MPGDRRAPPVHLPLGLLRHPDLLTYRQHRQGRRRRFKIRTRTYTDSGDCAFEIKLKGRRSETVKERLPHAIDDAERITPDARVRLDAALRSAYGLACPSGLAPMLRTDYRRHTLVDLAAGVRLTCDEDLVCTSGSGSAQARGVVLVEVKAVKPGGPADRLLWELGVRSVPVSKYCVGAAALFPGLGAGPWSRAVKECFGRADRVPIV